MKVLGGVKGWEKAGYPTYSHLSELMQKQPDYMLNEAYNLNTLRFSGLIAIKNTVFSEY